MIEVLKILYTCIEPQNAPKQNFERSLEPLIYISDSVLALGHLAQPVDGSVTRYQLFDATLHDVNG